jgi:hypothetical protein
VNHEQRIKKLEKQVALLTDIINGAELDREFVPIPQAAKHLNINPWVIRDRIKSDISLELDKHFKLNGSRYLINIKEWKSLIAADARAKRQ